MKIEVTEVTLEFKLKTKHSVTFVTFVTWGLYNFIGYSLMYDWEPSKYDVEHSLIQKAVRRGNVELVEKVFEYLLDKSQKQWLRDRLVVMAYEECWTYADKLLYPSIPHKVLAEYKSLTRTVKNKNAAGLAALAIKVKDGDRSAFVGDEKEQKAIKSVANGFTDPVGFWNFIRTEPGYNDNKQRIDAAEKAMNRAKFPGDRAMMLAAAYLSIKYPIPATTFMNSNNNPNFPYWIALDKHTSIGFQIISDASKKINLQPYDGNQLAFYFSGALCNKIKDSSFYKLSKQWKFKHMGFDCDQAKEKWLELRPLIIEMTKVDVEGMIKKINTVIKNDSDQGELF